MDDDWITTAEASQICGYHSERIRELLRGGRVRGKKFGPTWQVSRKSLLSYLSKMGAKGDKRGPKRSLD